MGVIISLSRMLLNNRPGNENKADKHHEEHHAKKKDVPDQAVCSPLLFIDTASVFISLFKAVLSCSSTVEQAVLFT